MQTKTTNDAAAMTKSLSMILHLTMTKPLRMIFLYLTVNEEVVKRVSTTKAATPKEQRIWLHYKRFFAATHEFAPVKPAKKQFMYWGGAPDSAAVMLVDRFVKYLTRLVPSH